MKRKHKQIAASYLRHLATGMSDEARKQRSIKSAATRRARALALAKSRDVATTEVSA